MLTGDVRFEAFPLVFGDVYKISSGIQGILLGTKGPLSTDFLERD